MTLQKAKNILHIDGNDNNEVIQTMIDTLPDYITLTTGLSAEDQAEEPLVDTVSGFLLTLWYYSDHTDDQKLNRTIANLLNCISLKARYANETLRGETL